MIFHRTWYLGFCKEETAVTQCSPGFPRASTYPAGIEGRLWFQPIKYCCCEPELSERGFAWTVWSLCSYKVPPSHHLGLREALLSLSFKAAYYPHLGFQSWRSQHGPPDQGLTVPGWDQSEMSSLCLLPLCLGLLRTAEQWSWPSLASLRGLNKKWGKRSKKWLLFSTNIMAEVARQGREK